MRCFLDLSSTGSQLRFLQNSLRPARAALGFIELAELQSVQLLQGSPSYCRTIPALAGASHVLELSGASHTWLLSANDVVGLRRWASQLRRAHQQALLAMHHFSTMVLLDGWLEFKGDNDEWSRGFFMLTIGAGLQCFEREPDEQVSPTPSCPIPSPSPSPNPNPNPNPNPDHDEQVSLQPLETLPLEQIACAVRAKGIDFYDWCIDVETVERDYIRVRPPSQAAMTRWLSAINLYCNPLPVEESEEPPPAPAAPAAPASAAAASAAAAAAASAAAAGGQPKPPAAPRVPQPPPERRRPPPHEAPPSSSSGAVYESAEYASASTPAAEYANLPGVDPQRRNPRLQSLSLRGSAVGGSFMETPFAEAADATPDTTAADVAAPVAQRPRRVRAHSFGMRSRKPKPPLAPDAKPDAAPASPTPGAPPSESATVTLPAGGAGTVKRSFSFGRRSRQRSTPSVPSLMEQVRAPSQ